MSEKHWVAWLPMYLESRIWTLSTLLDSGLSTGQTGIKLMDPNTFETEDLVLFLGMPLARPAF